MNNPNPWFMCRQPKQDVKLRLFCFPYAGRGASLYHAWQDFFPKTIELHAVQLPGRESRYREPRITSASLLAKKITEALVPFLDRPFAFFGYSIGALIAFETARELRRRNKQIPACLLIAARKAPQTSVVHSALAHLPQEEFLGQLRYYYQPSEDGWDNPEVLDVFLPILRDDIAISDTYEYTDEPPLTCPIDVYVGENDRGTPLADAQAWQVQTSAEFELSTFQGGHFFINTQLTELRHQILSRMLGFVRNNN